MHSCHNKLLSNYFDNCVLQSALFILTLQDYPLLTICFHLESILLHENVPLPLLAQTCGLQY